MHSQSTGTGGSVCTFFLLQVPRYFSASAISFVGFWASPEVSVHFSFSGFQDTSQHLREASSVFGLSVSDCPPVGGSTMVQSAAAVVLVCSSNEPILPGRHSGFSVGDILASSHMGVLSIVLSHSRST